MKAIIGMIAVLAMVGCSVQPVVSGPVVGSSHGNYFYTAQKEVAPPGLHRSSSHGGEY